ncbi:MAG: GH25 family lysozyme, partial [Sporolactobacillus sp.]
MKQFVKRSAAVLLFAVLLTGLFAGPWQPVAQASTAYNARVTVSKAAVHTGPGGRYHTVVKLSRNASVRVIGTRGQWKKISYGGKTRYIYANYIKKTSPSYSFRSYTAYVKSYSLVMRSKASSHYRKIRTLYMNYKVIVVGAKSGYSYVQYGSRKGYVRANYLKSRVTSYTAYVAPGSINLWNGPGAKYGRVTYLHQNNVVTVTGSSSGYLKVNYNGTKGYAWGGYFKNGTPPQAQVSPPAPAAPAPAPAPVQPVATTAPVQPQQTTTVQTAYVPTLSLRSEKFAPYSGYLIVDNQLVYLASDGKSLLGTLKKGETVQVVGETGKNVLIDFNGQTGQIPSSTVIKGSGSKTDGNGTLPPISNTSINGIDISHHQNDKGSIDFNALKNSGISFVIMKATEGDSYVDSDFHDGDNNYDNAKNAGLNTYAYHFLDDPSDYVNEAKNFMQELQKVNYPKNNYVFVDAETNSNKLDPTTFTKDIDAFLNILYQNDYKRFGIYTGYNFYYNNFDSQYLPTDALIWI